MGEIEAKDAAVPKSLTNANSGLNAKGQWFVYLLRCADGTLYTGISNDVSRRLQQHNAGTASRYTRSRLPVALLYQELQVSRSSALKRELAIKSLSRIAKETLIRPPEPTTNRQNSSMILRLSQKLCTKIKAGQLSEMPSDENPFADWSAHLFIVDRTQYILLTNTKSLYSTVMTGQGITNDSRFIERALSSIREFMEQDGHASVYDRCIAPAAKPVQFAKALSRAVTGSMNELVLAATYALQSGEVSPQTVGIKLNNLLLSAIATSKSDKYGRPSEAFQVMLNSAEE